MRSRIPAVRLFSTARRPSIALLAILFMLVQLVPPGYADARGYQHRSQMQHPLPAFAPGFTLPTPPESLKNWPLKQYMPVKLFSPQSQTLRVPFSAARKSLFTVDRVVKQPALPFKLDSRQSNKRSFVPDLHELLGQRRLVRANGFANALEKRVPRSREKVSRTRMIANAGVTGGDPMTGFKSWWSYLSGSLPGVGQYFVSMTQGGSDLNLIVTANDMSVANAGLPFTFDRVYNSHSQHDYIGSDGSQISQYGNGWTNTFDAHVATNPGNGNGLGNGISVFDATGARYDYYPGGNGTWIAPPGQYATLTNIPSPSGSQNYGFMWTQKDGSYAEFYDPHFDVAYNQGATFTVFDGRLAVLGGRNANTTIELSYYGVVGSSGDEEIDHIVAQTQSGLKATLRFAVTGNYRLLQTLTRPDNSVVSYQYDSNADLIEVDLPQNNESQSGCYMGSSCLRTMYAYFDGAAHLLDDVVGPRYFQSNDYANSQVNFNYSSQSSGGFLLGEIDRYGIVNPAISDGYSTGTIQGGPVQESTYSRTQITDGSPGQYIEVVDGDNHLQEFFVDSLGRTVVHFALGREEQNYVIVGANFTTSNQVSSIVNYYMDSQTDFAYDGNGNRTVIGEPTVTTSQGTFRPTTIVAYNQFNDPIAYCDQRYVHNTLHADWAQDSSSLATGSARPVTPPPAPTTACAAAAGVVQYNYAFPESEPFGELSSVTNADGYVESLSYNQSSGSIDLGSPTQILGTNMQQADGTSITPTETIQYNASGLVTSDNNGMGASTFSYDNMNRPVRAVDADGVVAAVTSYYPNGQIETSQSAAQSANNASVTYSYDAAGNLATQSTLSGCYKGVACNEIQYFHDGDDRLVEVVEPSDSRYDAYTYPWLTRYFYDLTQGGTNGSVSIGNQNGLTAYGNLYKAQRYLPNSSTAILKLQSISQGSWQDIAGQTYESLDRPTSVFDLAITEGVATPQNTYTYDENNASGLLTTIENNIQSGSTNQSQSITYDKLSRPISQVYNPYTQENATNVYDPDGNLSSRTVPDVDSVSYTYSPAGHIRSEIETPSSGNTQTASSTVTYTNYLDGKHEYLSILAQGGANFSQNHLFGYSFRLDGPLQSESVNWPGITQGYKFNYSSAGRMTTEQDPTYGQSFTYYGGAKSATLGALTKTYDSNGRLSQYVLPDGTTYNGFSYDNNGSLTSDTFLLQYGNASPQSTLAVGYTFRGELATQAITASNNMKTYNASSSIIYGDSGSGSSGTVIDTLTGVPEASAKSGQIDSMGRILSSTQAATDPSTGNRCTAELYRGFDFDNHLLFLLMSGYAFETETPTCSSASPSPRVPEALPTSNPEISSVAPNPIALLAKDTPSSSVIIKPGGTADKLLNTLALPAIVGNLANSVSVNSSVTGALSSVANPAETAAGSVENNQPTGNGETGQINYTWGANGHPFSAVYNTSRTSSTIYFHWAGDTLLYTSDANGALDVKIGRGGDLFQGSNATAYAQFLDRDYTGVVVSGRYLYSGGTVNEGDSISDPYLSEYLTTNYPDGLTNELGQISEPAADGIYDGYSAFQGTRVYDPTIGIFVSPDESSGSLEDPLSQTDFTRDRNNSYDFIDPTGNYSMCANGGTPQPDGTCGPASTGDDPSDDGSSGGGSGGGGGGLVGPPAMEPREIAHVHAKKSLSKDCLLSSLPVGVPGGYATYGKIADLSSQLPSSNPLELAFLVGRGQLFDFQRYVNGQPTFFPTQTVTNRSAIDAGNVGVGIATAAQGFPSFLIPLFYGLVQGSHYDPKAVHYAFTGYNYATQCLL